MAIPSNLFNNKPVDISEEFADYYQSQPAFISLFKDPGKVAPQRQHYWLESTHKPRYIAHTSATSTGVFTVADASKWNVGDYIRIKGYDVVFKITAITDNNTKIATSLVSSMGESITSSTVPTEGGLL